MDFHERLAAFFDTVNIKVSSIETKFGFSNRSLAKAIEEKRAIGSDRIEMILSNYPKLNANWLFREIGNMNITDEQLEHEKAQTTIADLRKTIAAMEKVIYYSDLTVERLKQDVSECEERLKSRQGPIV